jgi:hypothetical protein
MKKSKKSKARPQLDPMTPHWRKEFAKWRNRGDNNAFGDCNFDDDLHAMECIEKFEQLGGKIEIDRNFFCSIRVILPRSKDKKLVRERLLRQALTMDPRPTETSFPTRNRLELTWS